MCDKKNTPCPRCAGELDGKLEESDSGLECGACGFTPPPPCEACGGQTATDNGCGVAVCDNCNHHKGLARCYCGWSREGGNGLRELQEMGENCDEDY